MLVQTLDLVLVMSKKELYGDSLHQNLHEAHQELGSLISELQENGWEECDEAVEVSLMEVFWHLAAA